MKIIIMPTRTINKIHFTDLSPGRFEDLCQAMIFSLNPWESIHHYGRSGNDQGVDIFAVEALENGDKRNWHIQCKRYKSITKKQLEQVIDKAIGNMHNCSDVLLTIISCDLQRKSQEHYMEYAKKYGIKEAKLWTASYLESFLYNHRKDLLFAYFGVSLAYQTRLKEQSIKRNINLKKQMRHDFLKNNGRGYSSEELDKILIDPSQKFCDERVIIHSIDDTEYPNGDSFRMGVSSWFRVGLYDFYFNGIEIRSHLQEGIINNDHEWALVTQPDAKIDFKKYKKITILPCMRIPFSNIVAYDILGDEYYDEPHIYCRYSEDGAPYENIIFRLFTKKAESMT